MNFAFECHIHIIWRCFVVLIYAEQFYLTEPASRLLTGLSATQDVSDVFIDDIRP